MNVLYHVELSQVECGELTTMLSKGKRAARSCAPKYCWRRTAAAATRRLPAPWRWAAPPCIAPSGASWKAIWNGAERGPAAWGGAQAHGQGGSPARGNRLREPACGPRPLDAGTAGRRHGQAHRALEPVARDGAPGGWPKTAQAVAKITAFLAHSRPGALHECGLDDWIDPYRRSCRCADRDRPKKMRCPSDRKRLM
jgi:hypothetical protein